MPTIGLGTYTLKGDVLDSALRQAIQIGYRHIDTAPSYGNYSITHVYFTFIGIINIVLCDIKYIY